MSNWLDKLKEYAPSIASAVLSGGVTLPQLAYKAIEDATGLAITNEATAANAINSAKPEVMLKLKQANNDFQIEMQKACLAMGDALLLLAGQYHYSYQERLQRLKNWLARRKSCEGRVWCVKRICANSKVWLVMLWA